MLYMVIFKDAEPKQTIQHASPLAPALAEYRPASLAWLQLGLVCMSCSQRLGLNFSPASVLCKAARFNRGTRRAGAEGLAGSEAIVAA